MNSLPVTIRLRSGLDPVTWTTFSAGCPHPTDQVATLAMGSPREPVRALTR